MNDLLKTLGLNSTSSTGMEALALADYARKMKQQCISNARHEAQVDTYYGKEYDPPKSDCELDEDMNILVNNGVITDEETLRNFAQPPATGSEDAEETRRSRPKARTRWWLWIPLYFFLLGLGAGGAIATFRILDAIRNVDVDAQPYTWRFKDGK